MRGKGRGARRIRESHNFPPDVGARGEDFVALTGTEARRGCAVAPRPRGVSGGEGMEVAIASTMSRLRN